MIHDAIMIPYYLGLPQNELRGIDQCEQRKVNPIITYRNELDLEQQTIT